MKANERDSRTEQERFIDRMLKEILGGQRNPGDRLPTESELAAQYDLRKTNVHLALKELGKQGAHGHQPDGNPDPEIAAANAPFN